MLESSAGGCLSAAGTSTGHAVATAPCNASDAAQAWARNATARNALPCDVQCNTGTLYYYCSKANAISATCTSTLLRAFMSACSRLLLALLDGFLSVPPMLHTVGAAQGGHGLRAQHPGHRGVPRYELCSIQREPPTVMPSRTHVVLPTFTYDWYWWRLM